MMQGMLGQPEGGWPKVLQKIILDSAGAKPIKGRPGAKLPQGRISRPIKQGTGRQDSRASRATSDVLSYLMYPQVFLDYEKHLQQYDNTSVIPTPAFFYGLQSGEEISVEIEPGKTLIIRYLTTGEAREDGTAHGLLRAQRPAARSERARPHRWKATCTSSPRPMPDDPESRRRPDARKGFDGRGEERPGGESRRAAAVASKR